MGHFDVDVRLLKWFRLVRLPHHLALDGVLVEGHPSFELVVIQHSETYFVFEFTDVKDALGPHNWTVVRERQSTKYIGLTDSPASWA